MGCCGYGVVALAEVGRSVFESARGEGSRGQGNVFPAPIQPALELNVLLQLSSSNGDQASLPPTFLGCRSARASSCKLPTEPRVCHQHSLPPRPYECCAGGGGGGGGLREHPVPRGCEPPDHLCVFTQPSSPSGRPRCHRLSCRMTIATSAVAPRQRSSERLKEVVVRTEGS